MTDEKWHEIACDGCDGGSCRYLAVLGDGGIAFFCDNCAKERFGVEGPLRAFLSARLVGLALEDSVLYAVAR